MDDVDVDVVSIAPPSEATEPLLGYDETATEDTDPSPIPFNILGVPEASYKHDDDNDNDDGDSEYNINSQDCASDDDHDSDYIDPFDSGLRQKPKRMSMKRPRDGPRKYKRKNRSCGVCKSCLQTMDCMKCKYCLDMPKYGGLGTKRQKCLLRQCLQYSRLADMNRIDLEMLLEQKTFEVTPSDGSGVKGPLNLIMLDHPYFLTTDRVNREFQLDNHSLNYVQQEPLVSMQTSVTKHRSHTSSHRKKTEAKHPKTMKKQRRQQQTEAGPSFDFYDVYVPRRTRRQRDIYEQLFEEPVSVKQQCLGPGCVYAARQGSKYCSDECGIKLAKLRLQTFLPERVKEWNATPCIATQLDEQKLQQLAIKQEKLHGELKLLDEQKNRLDEIIERARKVAVIDEPETNDAETEGDLDLQVYCITCGHAVGFKKALIHMERCYAKVESLITFGSSFKTRCEGESIFCEYFSRKQKTYCKRLRVLCPEHQKEPKVGPDEACGCPLSDNKLAQHGDSDMCHLPKRTCLNHTGWERLRRAQIDLQRLQLWLKLEESQEKDHLIRRQMAHRGGVLGLLLNRTITH